MTKVHHSGNSRVGVQFYRNPNDTDRDVLFGTPGFSIDSATALAIADATNGEPRVTGFQYQRLLGEPDAGITFIIKSEVDLRDVVFADDWFDAILFEDGRPVHIDRGLVLSVTLAGNASSGATVETYVVECASWGIIYKLTRYWFDPIFQLEDANFAALYVHNLSGQFANQGVYRTVQAIAAGFLSRAVQSGNGRWTLPESMPGARLPQFNESETEFVRKPDFVDNVYSYDADYDDTLFIRRSHIGLQTSLNLGSNLWELMRTWSDPMSCETLIDLVNYSAGSNPPYIGMRNADYENGRELLSPGQTAMALIVRERPFYTLAERPEQLREMYFERTPLHNIRRELVGDIKTGRSNAALINHIAYAPIQIVERSAQAATYQIPRVNLSSIDAHGSRRTDIKTAYDVTEVNTRSANIFLDITRDFNSLNHLLLTGTIDLTVPRPEIRPGSRVRILRGDGALERAETYYVEGVRHSWSNGLAGGMKTSLTVTHGFRGTDQQYRDAVSRAAARWVDLRAGAVSDTDRTVIRLLDDRLDLLLNNLPR